MSESLILLFLAAVLALFIKFWRNRRSFVRTFKGLTLSERFVLAVVIMLMMNLVKALVL